MREDCKDKGKEENKKMSNRKVMWSSLWDSIPLPERQHTWENMANFGRGESSEEESLFNTGEVEIDNKEQQAKEKKENKLHPL